MKRLLTAVLLLFTMTVNAEVLTLKDESLVTIRGPISDSSAAEVISELLEKDRKLPKNVRIKLALDTPGGSIDTGNMIIEAAKGLSRGVDTVTVFAASMGYQTVQSLGTRYIIESGTLMSHRAAISGLSGQVPGEANSRLKFITDSVEEMEVRACSRAGLSLSAYKELVRDELWLTGNKAVATNHADKVVIIKCDDSLLGTVVKRYESFFGSFLVTFSKCPLITAPLSVRPDNKASNSVLKNEAMSNALETITRKDGKFIREINIFK